MARSKMKGEVIGIRLPLALDAEVRAAAAREGVSVGVYCANVISRRYVAGELERAVRPASNVRTEQCEHKSRTVIGGGLSRCTRCGALRGVDGVWKTG
jgi:surface antigen